MTPEEFIEKAIKGGWKYEAEDWKGEPFCDPSGCFIGDYESLIEPKHVNAILLDPKAWEAVGKVEGWKKCEELCPEARGYLYDDENTCWHGYMSRMLDALFLGKSIEEYLKTL